MGWLWRQAWAHLYRGKQLATGIKIYPLGPRNERICECGKKLWDSNKEGSKRHKRIDRARGGGQVGRPACRWG